MQHVDVLPQYAQTVSGGRLSAFWPVSTTPPPPPSSGPVIEFLMDDWVGCTSCPGLVAGLSPDGGTSGDFIFDWYTGGAFPSGEFTMTAWFNTDHVSDRQPIATKQGGGERGFVWEVSPISGKLRLEVWPNPSAFVMVESATLIAPGVTYRTAVTMDGTEAKLYLHGLLETTVAVGVPPVNTQPFDVGRYFWSSGYSRYFAGRLDNVRVYNRILSDEEIAAEQ